MAELDIGWKRITQSYNMCCEVVKTYTKPLWISSIHATYMVLVDKYINMQEVART